ncbi:MAG: hypothetical protein DCC67_16860 [Planctomycetota bacterium]|nr:MAG: hypothetical protein DCC67_16860 [Planctomycetota bacterium]
MVDQRKVAALLLPVVLAGCHVGVCAKRQSEECCPTDVRKTVPWCAGEDAIFQYPCGPSGDFYGHRPTCWRPWPTPAAAWRDTYCGVTVAAPVEEIRVLEDAPATPTPIPEIVPQVEPQVEPPAAPPQPDAGAAPAGPPVLPPPDRSAEQTESTLTPIGEYESDDDVSIRQAPSNPPANLASWLTARVFGQVRRPAPSRPVAGKRSVVGAAGAVRQAASRDDVPQQSPVVLSEYAALSYGAVSQGDRSLLPASLIVVNAATAPRGSGRAEVDAGATKPGRAPSPVKARRAPAEPITDFVR